MIRAVIPALILSFIAIPAKAEDSRLVEFEYDPAEIVRIEGKARVQATIRFGEDEVIENVAIGDSQAWQVTPNKRANLLFVKPLADNAVTNMTVVTSLRTYLFDLVASPRNEPVYMLSFTYPEVVVEEPEAELAAVGRANATELAAVRDPYAVVDPTQLNFEWASEGEAALFPTTIFDDGEATYMTWGSSAAVPAILIKDHEGTEGPVNFTVRGDTIVVDGVPREFVLRSGEEMARLVNNGPERTDDAAKMAQMAEAK
ncbi:MAG TPA: type VI secretion protein [Erythrobacter sp.]|nr:type VI secretion protein [Erythrobacter sp.]